MLPLFQAVLKMALIKKGIVTIEELFKLDMKMPDYQRPYSWSEKSVNTLFNDLNSACENDWKEYRRGTVFFIKEKIRTQIRYIII